MAPDILRSSSVNIAVLGRGWDLEYRIFYEVGGEENASGVR